MGLTLIMLFSNEMMCSLLLLVILINKYNYWDIQSPGTKNITTQEYNDQEDYSF